MKYTMYMIRDYYYAYYEINRACHTYDVIISP